MEMHSEILKPMAVLAAWTMFMWLWMYVTRIPAMSKAGVDTGSLTGGTGKDLDALSESRRIRDNCAGMNGRRK